MNWLQKNNYIVVLFITFMVIVGFLFITDNGKTTYEQIEIQHGDTLWNLAEHYRGDMKPQEWIKLVQSENHLNNEIIIAGQVLTIPINEESHYIAHNKLNGDSHSIEVASKDQ